MTKLTLTYVNRREKTSKTGKPFTSVSIKAKEYGDNFISGFGNAQNKSWKEGDIVEVTNVTEQAKDGKTYLNFEMPKVEKIGDVHLKLLHEIANRLTTVSLNVEKVVNHLGGKEKLNILSDGSRFPTFDKDYDAELDSLDKIAEEVKF